MKTLDHVTLTIPGLKKTYTFLHISDAHIAVAYSDDTAEDKALAEKHALRWTNADIPPVACFEKAISCAEEVQADALFITGDCADYISDSNVKYIKEKSTSSSVEFLYAYGNHECGDYFKPVLNPRAYYSEYASLMMGTPDFWVKDYGDLLVIGVDDSDLVITPEQLSKLKEQISRNIPIVLLLHIPLCTESIFQPVMEAWGSSFMLGTDEDSDTVKEFCNLVKSPDSNICAICAGHTHFSHVGEFAPGRMQYVAAACFFDYARKITLVPTTPENL